MRTSTEGLKSFSELGSDISVINPLNETNNFATKLQEHATLYFNLYANKSIKKSLSLFTFRSGITILTSSTSQIL